MTEPFKFGCIVDDEHFCPRPELQRELTRHIRGGQNLVLQGERRRGKSSLIVKAVRDIRGMNLLYVDLMGIETRSSAFLPDVFARPDERSRNRLSVSCLILSRVFRATFRSFVTHFGR